MGIACQTWPQALMLAYRFWIGLIFKPVVLILELFRIPLASPCGFALGYGLPRESMAQKR
jgi:hypothetical protein